MCSLYFSLYLHLAFPLHSSQACARRRASSRAPSLSLAPARLRHPSKARGKQTTSNKRARGIDPSKKKVESTRDESQTRPSSLTIFAVLDAAVRVGEMERAYNDDSQNLVTTLFIHFLYKETRETGDLVYIASIGIFAPG